MRTKRLIVGVAITATFLLALPSLAEGGRACRKGPKNPEKIVQRMQENLGLSEQQAEQVRAIFASHQSDFEQLREQMKQTFTEQQRETLKELRQQRRAEGSGPPSPEEREQRLLDIGVSEGQIQQLRSLKEQMKAEREEIKTELSAVLSPEQQTKLENLREQRKRRFQERRGRRQDG